ncbi:MAG: carbohydrate binding domain-containing protein [Elusimicrobia bacterium]|jgi:alpha-L-arabinofuranosidase|nr:carbohydrate binding domain-containing protein [Elusimicrobiota bacterium]
MNFKNAAFGFAIGVLCWGTTMATEVVVLDFNKISSATTLFGSNAQVNDNQKVQNRLFDERILDRGFEWSLDQKWTSVIQTATASISQDCTERYGDRCSAKTVINTFLSGSIVAMVQTAVWVESGQTYTYSFWAKQSSYGGNITVSMIDPNTLYSIVSNSGIHPSIASSWTQYSGSFTVTDSQVNGLFLLQFNGTGTVWIDNLSLIPTVTQSGLSPALFNAFGELGMKTMRFGSGSEANAYDWKKAVGPRDLRKSNVSVFHYYTQTAGDGFDKKPYYNDFGVDEFLQMSEAQGWTPVFIVNLASGPTIAAQWVEYCNGSPSTPFGAQRAANGRSTPYHVKYWEVGNEIWNQIAPEPGSLPNPGGYTQPNTDNYINAFRDFSDAMKAVDPTIFVGAVGGHKPSDGYMTGIVDPNWNQDLLAGAATQMDFLSIHVYATGRDNRMLDETTVYNALMGSPLFFEEEIISLKSLIAESGNPQIQIAVTEYAAQTTTTTGNSNFFFPQNLQSTLFMASMKNTFLRQGIRLVNQFDLLNESSSLVEFTLTAGFNATLIRHGPFYVETLYKDYLKPTLVDVQVTGTTFTSEPVGWMPGETSIPTVDALATLDSANKEISLLMVNRNKDNSVSVNLDFDNFSFPLTFEQGSVISGSAIDSRNTVATPNEIQRSGFNSSDVSSLLPSTKGEPRFQVTLPKLSVTALQFSFTEGSLQDVRAYPNPFQPNLHPRGIFFSSIPLDAHVRVFTITGALVRELSINEQNGETVWDGRNIEGQRVASGVYLVLIKSNLRSKTLKVVVQN